jgi:hypothetical protein
MPLLHKFNPLLWEPFRVTVVPAATPPPPAPPLAQAQLAGRGPVLWRLVVSLLLRMRRPQLPPLTHLQPL